MVVHCAVYHFVTHFLASETSPVLAADEERRDYYGNEEAANQANDRGEFLSCIFAFFILCFICCILYFVSYQSIDHGEFCQVLCISSSTVLSLLISYPLLIN